MKSKKILLLFALLVFMLNGCGGSGDSNGVQGSGGIQYTGLTTQAVINENNADEITSEAFQGGKTGSALGALGVESSGSNAQFKRPRTLVLSHILKETVRNVTIRPRSETSFTAVVQSESSSIAGECGGTANYSINLDDAGDFNGSFEFINYCSDGVNITGEVGFSGDVNIQSENFQYLTLSFNNLFTSSGDDSFAAKGDMTFDFSAYPVVATMNMLMKENSAGKVYRLENFRMTYADGSGYEEITMTGRYYDPEYGYADLSTPVAFQFYGTNDWPSYGEFNLSGATGIAGENTSAKLIAVSSSHCEIHADTNGDGNYNYSSGEVQWDSI